MGFYSNVVLPAFYERVMDRPEWREHRREQLASAEGTILEIGVGTGLNLPHYPKHVRRIVAVDPNPGMNRRLRRRVARSDIEVDARVLGSEKLPLDDASFDCVVSTITLCSIGDVSAALGEVFRVLKPSGRLLFLEHGLSPEPGVQKWQRRLNGIHGLLSDGCRLDLDVRALLERQPFTSIDIENFYMKHTPKTHGYMYRGTARK